MGGLDLPGSNEGRHIKDLPRIIVITRITKIIMVVTHHKKGIYHTIEEKSSPQNTCNGYRCILLVDCPTQLICFWIFICSMTKLKEHSREICELNQEYKGTSPQGILDYIKYSSYCLECRRRFVFVKRGKTKLSFSVRNSRICL